MIVVFCAETISHLYLVLGSFSNTIMPKRHVLVDRTTPGPKQSKPTSINWELCVLCQDEDAEPLQCPARSTKASIGSAYSSLANHIMQFQQLGSMPIDINIERLDDGDDIEATFATHVARWHKSCRLKFNQTKLDRLQKKSSETSKAGTSATMNRRSSHYKIDLKEPICFLCTESEGSTGGSRTLQHRTRPHNDITANGHNRTTT